MKGTYIRTPEIKKKNSISNMGYKHTPETIEKLRIKGLHKRHTPETIEKMRLSKMGSKNPFYGKHHINPGKPFLGKHHTPEHCRHMRELNLGKKLSKEHKKKLSEWRKGRFCGDKHPNWMGGKTLEAYGSEFNKILKEKILIRDGYKCRECGSDGRLNVHHVDYNKRNNIPENLITLCCRCHAKTNFDRLDWIKHFEIIKERDYE